MIYLFTAEWCGPCKMLKVWLYENPHVKEKVSIIDVDDDFDRAELYGVKGIPCLVIVDGEVKHNITGLPNIMKFLKGE